MSILLSSVGKKKEKKKKEVHANAIINAVKNIP